MKSEKNKLTNSARYKCLEYLKKDSMDLYLCYCGFEACDPGHFYGPTQRTEYLLHIVISGKGHYVIGDKTYHLHTNQAFLIYPGMTTYYEADKEDPWTYIWVAYNGIKAESSNEYMGLSKDSPVCELQDTKILLQCVNGMLEASQLTFAADIEREAYLYMFISNLMKQTHTMQAPSIDYSHQVYVDYVLEYIEHNYQNDIRISEIAKNIGLNRSYLSKCFSTCLNISPQKYLLNFRMNKAIALLRSTSLPINEIALQVGYDDALAFSKVFKTFYGTSPKTYREEQVKK